MSGRFELRDHTADVAVEATADTLGGVFAAVADGLAAAMCDGWPETGDRFELSLSAENPEAALYDYLDELIYQRDVRSVLPVDNRATVSREPAAGAPREGEGQAADDGSWLVDASAQGVPLDAVVARDIKAVTYSDMVLEERDDSWYAYVVFDV